MTGPGAHETPRPAAARRRALGACLAATLGLLVGTSALAAGTGRAVPPDLLQKAATGGTVRVIVELGGVGALPEGHLPSQAAIAAQRARIASDRALLRSALRGLRHRVLREFKTIPYMGLEADHDTLRVLDSLPGLVTRVHESKYYKATLAQSTPLIKAPDAWNAGWDGSDQAIAILDTGVDKSHPFLIGKIVGEACYDSSGISACPNGAMSQTGPDAGVPCTFAPNDCRHGTHVAGIAAGNGASFDGVARGASLVAIRVFSLWDCGGAPCAVAWDMDIVNGLERVLELSDTLPIAAANMSLGGDAFLGPCDSDDPMMTAAIVNLRTAGIATVVASGNDGYLNAISSPACISSAISVGATGDGSGSWPTDQVSWFSNSAYFLSLLAPGYLINSSVPGGGFANFYGTSMAAPHVAGAWAVMKQANPDASVDEILAGLQNTGRPITDVNLVTTSRIAFTVLQFSATAYSASESAGAIAVAVTRTGAPFGTVTVDYATSAGTALSGQDYTDTSGTLTFNPGETSKTFTVAIGNDTAADGPRTVTLTLTDPGGGALLGARDTALLTIGDNDVAGSIQFSAAAYGAGEQAGTATITVTRSGGSAGNVTVQYATADGSGHASVDYELATGALEFGPGEMSRTFQVTILPNGLADGNRTVALGLHTPGGGGVLGGQKTAVLTIVDDEIALQFSQAAYGVNEGSGSLTITVTRSGPVGPPVGVTYALVPGSASAGDDHGGPFTGVLAFAANQATRTFTVPIVNDKLAEGPETVLLQLSSPTGGAILGVRQTAVLTIVDNDAGGAFRFGSSSYVVSETAPTASVVVTRSNGAAGNGQVRVVSTVDGTAVPGVDYAPVDQIVSFPADQSSRTVLVTLLPEANNTTVDAPRTVKLALQDPQPLGLSSLGSPAATTVTIADNDAGGTIQFASSSLNALETAGSAVLTVTRTGGGASGVGVTWEIALAGTAVHGTDYDGPLTGSLGFDGGPSQSIVIPLLDPPGAHGTRTIQVKLKDPTGGAKLGGAVTAMVNILDDTVGFRFDKATYSVSEGSGSQTITVLRTGPSAVPASVTAATVEGEDATAVPGTDYTPVGVVLNFLAGQTSKTFAVPLKNDLALDGLRWVKLRLSGPSGSAALGSPSEAVLNISDNDAAGTFRFASGTYTVTEPSSAALTVNVTVTRTGGTGGSVQLPWSITGGTATTGLAADPGVDVLIGASGALTFGPGETSKTIQAVVLSDTDVESNETVKIGLGSPTPGGSVGAPSEATLVVVDGDRQGTIQFAAPAVNGGEATGTVVIAVTRSGNLTQPATVDWTITGGTATRGDAPGAGVDYVSPTGGTLSFSAGQGTPAAPLAITVSGDALLEGPETLELALQNPGPGWALGAVPSTILTLVEGTVQFTAPGITVNEGSGSATVTITRSGLTTQPLTVSYAGGPPGSATPAATPTACSPGADYRPVAGSLVFGPGQTSRTFSVPLCGDSLVEGDETLTLTLAVVSGPAIPGPSGDTATLTITENDLGGALRFSSAAYSAGEGQAASVTVNRTGSGGGVSVHWAVVGGTAIAGVDYTGPTSGDLTFSAGQTSRSIMIPLANTDLADGPRTIELELSAPLPGGLASLGSPTHAVLTINDNEPTLRLNSAAYAVGEGSASFNVTVLRAGSTAAAVSVDLAPQATGLATGGACETDGVDFAAGAIHVEIPPGQGSRTVAVPICPDTRAEGTESFGLALQNAVGATLGSPAAATVSLTDNEVGGTVRWSLADTSGVEGTVLVLAVNRTGGTASDVTVHATAFDGDGDTPGADAVAGVDYEPPPSTPVTFGLNGTSGTVAIPLLSRDGVQGPRAFRVTLHDVEGGGTLGSPSTVTVWILDPG